MFWRLTVHRPTLRGEKIRGQSHIWHRNRTFTGEHHQWLWDRDGAQATITGSLNLHQQSSSLWTSSASADPRLEPSSLSCSHPCNYTWLNLLNWYLLCLNRFQHTHKEVKGQLSVTNRYSISVLVLHLSVSLPPLLRLLTSSSHHRGTKPDTHPASSAPAGHINHAWPHLITHLLLSLGAIWHQ